MEHLIKLAANMKNPIRALFFSLTMALAATAFAASLPTLDVTVSDSKGKIAYKGKTVPDGSFATGALPPGNYVVQFSSHKNLEGSYGVVLAAGKQKVLSGSVPGAKFAGGGVAMKVKVGQGVNISGKIVTDKAGVLAGEGSVNSKVKIVDGKRFVWMGPETGSHIGGRWVEEGTPSNVIKAGRNSLDTNQSGGVSIGR